MKFQGTLNTQNDLEKRTTELVKMHKVSEEGEEEGRWKAKIQFRRNF